MTPGSVFFHTEFEFHDGESGEKLFVALGYSDNFTLVEKTTSKQRGKGTVFGCQPTDRLHNFYIPKGATYLKKCSWVCLNEFYDLHTLQTLQLRTKGVINPVCTFENAIIKSIQECAMESEDISKAQHDIIAACLV